MKRLLAVALCLVIVLLIGLPALLIRACGGTEIPPPPDSDDEPCPSPTGADADNLSAPAVNC